MSKQGQVFVRRGSLKIGSRKDLASPYKYTNGNLMTKSRLRRRRLKLEKRPSTHQLSPLIPSVVKQCYPSGSVQRSIKKVPVPLDRFEELVEGLKQCKSEEKVCDVKDKPLQKLRNDSNNPDAENKKSIERNKMLSKKIAHAKKNIEPKKSTRIMRSSSICMIPSLPLNSVMDHNFHEEFIARANEFSPSWREALEKMKKH